MRLPSFLPIGAFLLLCEFAVAQSVSSTVTAPTPSGTFNAVAALAAYGVNVSDYSSSDSSSVNSRRTSTSPSKGCSFSVSIIPLTEPCPCNTDPKNYCQCSTLSLLYSGSVSPQGSSSYNLLESGYWS